MQLLGGSYDILAVGFQETLTSLRLCLWNQHPRGLAAGQGGKRVVLRRGRYSRWDPTLKGSPIGAAAAGGLWTREGGAA